LYAVHKVWLFVCKQGTATASSRSCLLKPVIKRLLLHTIYMVMFVGQDGYSWDTYNLRAQPAKVVIFAVHKRISISLIVGNLINGRISDPKVLAKVFFSKVRRSLHHAHSTMNSLLSLCDLNITGIITNVICAPKNGHISWYCVMHGHCKI